MYKIGEASKLTKVSTRMLRYYDQEKILKPSYIGINGYRYYTDENLCEISKIIMLRKYEFSYEEIKDILVHNKYDDVEIYTNKITQLKTNITKYGYLIAEIESKKQTTTLKDKLLNTYDISMGERECVDALCRRVVISDDEIDPFIETCYADIANSNVMKIGKYHLEFYNNNLLGEKMYEIEYVQPVRESEIIEGFESKLLEKNTYISTIHYGDYEKFSDAYHALYRWTKNNNFKIKGNFLERYFVDASLVSSSSEFVTEVAIQVLKKS